jgi:hypothetical protein
MRSVIWPKTSNMPIDQQHLLTDAEELLHRNAHPQFVENGRPSSLVFCLHGNDQGQLSTQRNSKASADVAYQRYTARGKPSCGVWSVTINECQAIELSAYDDPIDDDDSHSIIDLTAFNTNQARKRTDKLARKARDRGCQYDPSAQ